MELKPKMVWRSCPMSSTYLSDSDYISHNPFLRHILSLLDAQQVLRCLRVSKQFYNTILNNWNDMEKVSKNLTIAQQGRNDKIFSLDVHCDFPGAYYHFYIRTLSVSTSCYGNMQPVRTLFERQSEDDRAVEIRKNGEIVDVEVPKQRVEPKKSIATSVFTKLKLRKPVPARPYYPPKPQRPEFAGKFAVSNYIEGLSIVLDFLLSRCNLGELKICEFHDACTERIFEAILQSVRNTGVKLVSIASVYQLSNALMETLKCIEAKRVKLMMLEVLSNSMLYLRTHNCTVSIFVNNFRFLSLTPIALLIEEWQQGRRDIKCVRFFHDYSQCRFTIPQFQQMVERFEGMTLLSSSESDIEVFIEREGDSKVLLIEYSREGYKYKNRPPYRRRSSHGKCGFVSVEQSLVDKALLLKIIQ